MERVAFTLLGKDIYWYGVLVALGFLAVVIYWGKLEKKLGLPRSTGSDFAFWAIIGGVIGARIAYVGANWSEYAADPLTIFRIDQGGLVFYGGFIGGTLAGMLFARMKGLPILMLGDFAVTGVPLGHAFGRMGCFLNGCCYGRACDLPWAVETAGMMRHPVQLYEAGLNLLLCGFLFWLILSRHRRGVVTAAYFMVYPLFRFTLEFFRGDQRLGAGVVDLAQLTSLVLFAVGVFIFWLSRRQPIVEQAIKMDVGEKKGA